MKSTQFDALELSRLKELLKGCGIKEIGTKSAHETYRFDDRRKDVLVIGYKSGKIVYKEGDLLRDLIDKSVEKTEGFDYLLGTDEAGKGEWYGPLVVACVAAAPEEIAVLKHMGVMDSKQLGAKNLMKLGDKLVRSGVKRKVLMLPPDEYNIRYAELKKEGKTLNDLMAKAHAKLVKDLLAELGPGRARVVIDMFDYKKTQEELRGVERHGHVVIQKNRAESETPVAAASVLAKYFFEKEVGRLDREYGIRLKRTIPAAIPKDVLPHVAKMHFRNVAAA